MKIKPLGKRLVIEKAEAEETTASGIVLPSTAQEAPQFAIVRALGEKLEGKDKYGVNIGDKVIYSRYAGTEVELDGKEYIVIPYKEILAVVSN